MAQAQSPTWRLVLTWHGRVRDVVRLLPDTSTISTTLGLQLSLAVASDTVTITHGNASWVLDEGASALIAPGVSARLVREVPFSPLRSTLTVDATLFHAVMMAIAAEIALVAALVFAPPQLDALGQAGLPGAVPSLFSVVGGGAMRQGAPSVSLPGRKPAEAERALGLWQHGGATAPAPTVPGQRPAVAFVRVDTELGLLGQTHDAMGEMVRALAQAPVKAASAGGLLPRETPASGTGAGLIDVGAVRLSTTEHQKPLPPRLGKGRRIEVPTGEVGFELDASVRDEIHRVVRERENAIRTCYESFALASDPRLLGRIVLHLTLLPTGRVEGVDVVAERPELDRVAVCVKDRAQTWFFGDGWVEAPVRLAFPFQLRPSAP